MRYSKVKSDVGNHAEFSQQIWPFLNFTIFEILKSRPQNFGTVPTSWKSPFMTSSWWEHFSKTGKKYK